MKYQKCLKYNIKEGIKEVMIFYVIIAVVLLFSLLAIASITDNSVKSSISGTEFSSVIFIFVLGLNSFKERFLMMMQNGVSRKNFFLSSIISFVILCLFMSVVDGLISLLAKYIMNFSYYISYSSLFDNIYNGTVVGTSTVIISLQSILFNLCIYLAMAIIGFFITISYYRMSKTMKVIISVGVPVGLFVVLPIVDEIVGNQIYYAIGRVPNFAMGVNSNKPLYAMVTFLLISVVFSGLSWLLARKAMVRSN